MTYSTVNSSQLNPEDLGKSKPFQKWTTFQEHSDDPSRKTQKIHTYIQGSVELSPHNKGWLSS